MSPLSSLLISILIFGVDGNPLWGLLDSNCFVAKGDCPNENITFWLYTKEDPTSPKLLNPLELNPWDFQPPRRIKILIHGYTGDKDFSPNSHIRPVLLEMDDVNVISVDFNPLVRRPCYFAAVQNLPYVAKCLGQLINNMIEQNVVQNEQIHVIGFSLGAQVAGQTANYLKHKLKRLTGLDPAKPMFITVDKDKKLDPSDAEFVDVIHTDVLGRGMLRSMGHVDFYPNLGLYQPGCRDELPSDPGSCNHDRAPRYYAESIRGDKHFWCYSCPSWLHYMFGFCTVQSNDAIMGYHANESYQGSYFLQTESAPPYAMGYLVANSSLKNNYDEDLLWGSFDYDFEPQLTKSFEDYLDTGYQSTEENSLENMIGNDYDSAY